MPYYRLSPNIYLEFFDDEAIFLVADRDVMVTANRAAAQLFSKARDVIADRAFSRSDCIDFLLEHYDMGEREATRQVRSILGFALRQRLVLRCQ